MARQELRVDGTLDIECADWDVFCVGATYDGSDARVYYDGDQMVDDLRRAGGTYYAHAGGVYDLLYVLDRLLVRGIPCQVDRSQHRVTRVVVGGLTLRDSYSLWPAPLGDLCGAIGEVEPRLPWPCLCCARCGVGRRCECGRGCGGFCQISARARSGDPDLEDYVCADARCLYRGLRHLREVAADHRISLRGTLGQTAWVSAQDELGIPDSEIPYHLWRHARTADKGGRAVVVRPRVGSAPPDALVEWDSRSRVERELFDRPVGSVEVVGAHHDICSAYPAQLARAHLPVGACRELGGRDAASALDRRMAGLYTVSVTVPDTFLPPLPWHKSTGLCYPTGEFSGTWVLPEIEAAQERGVEIRQVHTALVWEASAAVFAPLVHRWYEVRRALGRKTPMGRWVAGLAKALTGTLAMGPDRDRVSMFPDPEKIRLCPRTGPCRSARKCTRRCGAYEQLDLRGHVWAIPYHQMPKSAYPQWSAYLRAMTRVQWLSQAERMGLSLCMGNTDSLWHLSRQEPEPLGDGIGQWEYQHAFTSLEARSPTIYAYRDPASDPPGSLQIRGIPGITEAEWRRGSGVLDRGIVTFTTAVGSDRGLFHRRSRRWSLPGAERTLYGDRRLAGDGVTYPLDAAEIRELGRLVEQRRLVRERVDETRG